MMPCTSSSSAGGKIASASDISLDSFLQASTSSHHNSSSRGGADVELPLDDGVSFARLQSPCPGTYTA